MKMAELLPLKEYPFTLIVHVSVIEDSALSDVDSLKHFDPVFRTHTTDIVRCFFCHCQTEE